MAAPPSEPPAAADAGERILVGLTGADGGESLLRRAADLAARSQGPLIGVHVRDSRALASQRPPGLEGQRRLLDSLGGVYREAVGPDPAAALLEVASAERVTQIVLGASRRSRLSELLRGSVVNGVIRGSGSVDVHVISPGHEGERARGIWRRRRLPPAGVGGRPALLALIIAMAVLPLLTALLVPHRDHIGLTTALLLYLLVAVGVAAAGGILPAAVVTFATFVLANYYFTKPYETLIVYDAEDYIGVFVFLVVAGVVSLLVDYAARRNTEAGRSRIEAEALARLAVPPAEQADPLVEVAERLREAFALEGVAVLRHQKVGGWRVEAGVGMVVPRQPEAADNVAEITPGLLVALVGGQLADDDHRVLAAYLSQIKAAFATRELRAQASKAANLAEINELRAALLSAVSHDLRTPLSTIKASVTSLLGPEVEWPPNEEQRFLTSISVETDRLNRLIGNLLDASRISADAVEALVAPVSLDEVVPLALAGLPPPQTALVVDVPETLPLVLADPALLERAVANLVENAIRHCPPGSKVRVEAEQVGDEVELRVIDHGPGIPEHERERVFRPFQRLRDSGDGAGLGLAIARGFVEAIGGRLTLGATPGGGTTVTVRLGRQR